MTKSKYEVELEIAARLYGPKPEGRILNTTFVKDREEQGSSPDNPDSSYERALKRARELYGPKDEGRIVNSTFVVDR